MAVDFLTAECGSERGPHVVTRPFRPSAPPDAEPRDRQGTTPLQALVRLLALMAAREHMATAPDTDDTPVPSSSIEEHPERTR